MKKALMFLVLCGFAFAHTPPLERLEPTVTPGSPDTQEQALLVGQNKIIATVNAILDGILQVDWAILFNDVQGRMTKLEDRVAKLELATEPLIPPE